MTGRKSSGSKSKSKSSGSSQAAPARPVTSPVPAPPAAKMAAMAAATPAPGLIPKPPSESKSNGVTDAASNEGTSKDGALENTAPEMRKQELMAKVVERSGVAKKHAKPVIEAMLEVLGEAIGDGRELNLQPLGKLKHNRIKDTPSARIIVAKIRQPKAGSSGPPVAKEPVADAAE